MCFKEGLHVAPAYGRDYASEWDARCAWFGGVDFKAINGPYVSVRDSAALQQEGRPCVVLHFAGFTRKVIVGLRRSDALAHEVQASRVREHVARLRVADALRDTVDA